MENILTSVKKKPREVTLILYYCTYEIMTALRKYPLTLEKVLKLPGYEEDPDEKAYIYKMNI